MKIDIEELAKSTIKEIQESLDEKEIIMTNTTGVIQETIQEKPYELEQIKTADDAVLVLKDEFKKSEELFLKDVKERLLVLFEGLNVNDDKTEQRLKITLEFLEFLLASIEDRLK